MPNLSIPVEDHRTVSAILDRPRGARWLYVMAHGMGAGMRHGFLQAITDRLVAAQVAVLRYQFPYMEAGLKRPDRPAVLEATVRAALQTARRRTRLPLVAGGKSLGARMTSRLVAAEDVPRLRGLAFLGYPLHRPGAPSTERAAHLPRIRKPMLFLQGTRDPLADLSLIGEVCAGLGRRATLQVVQGGDHSFGVLKRSGRTADEVHDELANALVTWGDALH